MFNLLNYATRDDITEYDSLDELYFMWYLDDLVKAGIIKEYYRAKEIPLFEASKLSLRVMGKKKESKVRRNLPLHSKIVYTPDFIIVWTKDILITRYDLTEQFVNSAGTFLARVSGGEVVSVIDIKPSTAFQTKFNTSYTFPIKQAILYDKHKVLVQKIQIKTLFKETFTPSRYLRTDKNFGDRKIQWKAKTLDEYVANNGFRLHPL